MRRASYCGAIEASERAADLTRQLPAYAGKARRVIERIDLTEIVRGMAQLLESSIPRTVELCLELTPGLPLIEGDANQVQQISGGKRQRRPRSVPDCGGTYLARNPGYDHAGNERRRDSRTTEAH